MEDSPAAQSECLWGWLNLLPLLGSSTIALPLPPDVSDAARPTARILVERYLVSGQPWESDDAALAHIEEAVAGAVAPSHFGELQAWAELLDLGRRSSDAWLLGLVLARASGEDTVRPTLRNRITAIWNLPRDRVQLDAWDSNLERVCPTVDLIAVARSLGEVLALFEFRALVRSLPESDWNAVRGLVRGHADQFELPRVEAVLEELRGKHP